MTHERTSRIRSSLSHFFTLSRQTDTRSVRSDFASAAWPLRYYKSLKAYLGALFVSPLNIQYFFLYSVRAFHWFSWRRLVPSQNTHTHEARRNFECVRVFSPAARIRVNHFASVHVWPQKVCEHFFLNFDRQVKELHRLLIFWDNEREILRGARLESCKLHVRARSIFASEYDNYPSLALLKLTINALKNTSDADYRQIAAAGGICFLMKQLYSLIESNWAKVQTVEKIGMKVLPLAKVSFNSRKLRFLTIICARVGLRFRELQCSGKIINSAPVTPSIHWPAGFILARSKINTRRPAGFLHWKIVMSHGCRHIRRCISNRPN